MLIKQIINIDWGVEEELSLIKCPEYGKGISNTANRCIYCGFELKK